MAKHPFDSFAFFFGSVFSALALAFMAWETNVWGLADDSSVETDTTTVSIEVVFGSTILAVGALVLGLTIWRAVARRDDAAVAATATMPLAEASTLTTPAPVTEPVDQFSTTDDTDLLADDIDVPTDETAAGTGSGSLFSTDMTWSEDEPRPDTTPDESDNDR